MDQQTLRAALGTGDGTADLLHEWTASQAMLPAGPLFFLDAPYVALAAQDADLDPDLATALLVAALRIDADPLARSLAWHVYYRLFRDPSLDRAATSRWPSLRPLLDDDAGLLYPLALFGGMPELRALYHEHAVPEQVACETLHDVQRWATHHRRRHGRWGIEPIHLTWFRLHLCGALYSLGRLQFELGSWTLPARAFRHRASGAVTALSDDGVRYRADGMRDGAGGVQDPIGTWAARLELTPAWAVGHRITPDGCADRAETRLSLAEWRQALAPGDAVLHLHIPRGAPLDLDVCRRSLEQALRFFPAHFPAHPFVAFACESWLLDDQIGALLSPTSNLVRFQRQFYLLPVDGTDDETLDWVFDGVPDDLAAAPRDTSLRRAVLDHLGDGGHFHSGGCFLLPEDLPAWGADVYRRP